MSEKRTLRSRKLRNLLWIAADGKCKLCGCNLDPNNWHADHIVPWSKTHRTNVFDMQALCPSCNLKKGSHGMKPRTFFTNSRRILASKVRDCYNQFVALVECGSGKSTLPPAFAYDLKRAGVIDALMWLVPRKSLVKQAEEAMDYHSDSGWIWSDLLCLPEGYSSTFKISGLCNGNPKAGDDVFQGFGYATSYQSLMSQPYLHLEFLKKRKVLVVADEIQLCEVNRSFGNVITQVKENAAFFLAMSGDFDRPGREEVAGLEYEPYNEGNGKNCRKVKTDIEYNIYDALSDHAILPLDYCYGHGPVGFTDKDKNEQRFDAIDEVPMKYASDALWAAISTDYGNELLDRCVRSWCGHRETGRCENRIVTPQPKAQMLVVCATQEQAKQVMHRLTHNHQIGENRIALAISDENKAAKRVKQFRQSEKDIMVTVAMAYIGVDAPRISHLCCLTSYRSPSWLRQMLARAWRISPDVSDYSKEQYAVCFVPNDPKWKKAIEAIKRAKSIGAVDPEEDLGISGDRKDAASNHWSRLNYTENVYEIFVENPWLSDECKTAEENDDVVDTANNISYPSDQTIRDALAPTGLSEEQILAAIEATKNPSIFSSVLDTRTPIQRKIELARDLNRYLQRTTFLMKKPNEPTEEDFSYVNKAFEEFTGWKRADIKLSEQKLQDSLCIYAPRFREKMLG